MLAETVSPASDIEIDTEELRVRLASAAPPLLAEILSPQHFATGHLPGAVNLPLATFDEAVGLLLLDRDAEVVVYCASHTCRNSSIAERKLRALGYRQVRVYSGGKAAWQAAGHALET